MKKFSNKIVLLLPTLNEEKGLSNILENIKKLSFKVEIVIVDGLSTDKTREIAKKNSIVVVWETKKGYGYAMQSGLSYVATVYSEDTIVVILDADGTYEVKDIIKLIEPIIKSESDFVTGNRQFKNMSFKTQFGNKLISKLANFCLGLGVIDTQSGMKALKVKLAKRLEIYTDGISWQVEFITQAKREGARIKEIPINYNCRTGEKKLGRIKDGLHEVYSILKLFRYKEIFKY